MSNAPTEEDVAGGSAQLARRGFRGALMVTAILAFLSAIHNYGINLLPYASRIISPDEMVPHSPGPCFAYRVPFDEAIPDRVREMRSRTILTEDGRPHSIRTTNLVEIRTVGGDRYGHFDGEVIFATIDNSDPRTNGRVYALSWPLLYGTAIGRGSVFVMVASVLVLLLWRRPPSRPVAVRRWSGWAWWAALLVFVAGLYANTGTRSPYAVSYAGYTDPATGFVYNQDHVHFKVLFAFVDGQPREVWDGALLLRRILYPVLAWPAMKVLGFEAGGVAMNLLIHVVAFVGCTYWLNRRIGPRAAHLGAWIMATYPGFAYWVGQPYPYALIAPGSLLLTIALSELAIAGSIRRIAFWSTVMGITYLAYDFAPVFLPATLGLLLWGRRWMHAGIALIGGVVPLLAWLVILRYGFGQGLENSNTGVYTAVYGAFFSAKSWASWLGVLPSIVDSVIAVFFGSNFIFLPALFIGALLVNPWTARIRLTVVDWAILSGASGLFAFINLASDYSGDWNLAGSWIARLYQPIFPVILFYLARWWQELPAMSRLGRVSLCAGLVAAGIGNLLVIFGPVAGNPGKISGDAFYRFYTHLNGTRIPIYDQNLQSTPVRLFGFGQPKQPAE